MKTFVVLFAALILTPAQAADPLYRIARRSLEANIVHLSSGDYLAAGANQFRSLWTRDFCFASRGLFAIGRADVVKRQLTRLIRDRRAPDSLVPRVLDSMNSEKRIRNKSLSRVLPFIRSKYPLKEPLRVEHVDEHGTMAYDSNALVLLTALEYVRVTGDQAWWDAHRESLKSIFRFYEEFRDTDLLLVQDKFGDWQDSVKREGKTLYLNLLYYTVAKRLSVADPSFKVRPEHVWDLQQSIIRAFRERFSGLFLSISGWGEDGRHPYISLDGNLLALEWEFYEPGSPEAFKLWESIRGSFFWRNGFGVSADPLATELPLPGWVTYPNYPAKWREFSVSVAGMGHYHDELYWSWLMALAAKTARRMGDEYEARRITAGLRQLAVRDGAINETYAPKPGLPPFETWLYRSEAPFSWGAGFVLDLLL